MGVTSKGAQVRERLMCIVEELTESEIKPRREEGGEGSIRTLGLNSVTMLNLLVAVEDEFGIEWDDDVEADVLDSFDEMAAHVLAERA